MSDTRNPTPREVQLIFKDTYIFYTKWFAVNEPDWDELLTDSREIEARYPFEICTKMLAELVMIIEKSYTERKCSDG